MYNQKNFNSFTPRSDQKGKPLYNIAIFSNKKMMVTFFFFKWMNFILWQDRRKILTVGFVWFNTKFSKLKLLEMKDREWRIYIQMLGMKWFKPSVIRNWSWRSTSICGTSSLILIIIKIRSSEKSMCMSVNSFINKRIQIQIIVSLFSSVNKTHSTSVSSCLLEFGMH